MMAEPLQGRVVITDSPGADNLFVRIAKGAWDIVSDLGHEFAEHAPEIAANIASSYMAAQQNRGMGVDLSKYDVPTSLHTALHLTNPYKPQKMTLPERRQTNTVRTALQNTQPPRTENRSSQRRSQNSWGATSGNAIAGLTHNAMPFNQAPVSGYSPSSQGDSYNTPSFNPQYQAQQRQAYEYQPVQENPYHIQQNLSYGQKPKTYLQAKQEHDLAMAQAQAEQQRQQYRKQRLHEIEQERQAMPRNISKALGTDKPLQQQTPLEALLNGLKNTGVKPETIAKLRDGKMLTDNELRQVFHTLDLKLHGARNAMEKILAEKQVETFKRRMAEIMTGPEALLLTDGYIVVNDVGYKPSHAYAAAMLDLNHFQENEEHRPVRFLTEGEGALKPGAKLPDVTDVYQQKLDEVAAVSKKAGPTWALQNFPKYFGNNGAWDMQGELGLPGQKIKRDEKGNPIPDPTYKGPGVRYQSDDLYAMRNGEVWRAGNFSNFIVGYGSAASSLPALAPVAGAEKYSWEENRKWDNEEDIRAIERGWWEYSKKTAPYPAYPYLGPPSTPFPVMDHSPFKE